tara:strand:- start:20097 stop:20639 length:543 start_codon:yes stop_codon:yes gene_type:complete
MATDIWLKEAAHTPSPNFNSRPLNQLVDLIVIHCISLPPGVFEGDSIEKFFQNKLDFEKHPYFKNLRDLKVSSHFLIRRNGYTQQFVALNKRAWHAGDSSFAGKNDCNDYSVGIELEGTETDYFEDDQYKSLMKLTKSICKYFPLITLDRIIGHDKVSPNRKTDPGPFFDWDKYKSNIKL